MYGTKDTVLDDASENAMTAIKSSLCLYHSSAVAMSVSRHGDDFVVSGTRTQPKEFEEQVSKKGISSSSILPHWDHAQHRETSQDCEMGQTSVRIGTWYEADPRHAELTLDSAVHHEVCPSCLHPIMGPMSLWT